MIEILDEYKKLIIDANDKLNRSRFIGRYFARKRFLQLISHYQAFETLEKLGFIKNNML